MKVLLVTLHSKYVHSSLALPYLAAYCKNIDGAELLIREFTIHQNNEAIVSAILRESPDAVAFSCYIWNVERVIGIAADIKRQLNSLFVILGGPEVSYDSVALLNKHPFIDCVVKGEGERTFKRIVQYLALSSGFPHRYLEDLDGITYRNSANIIDNGQAPPIDDLDSIPSPFAGGLVDMRKKLIYYESSRGCPFSCAFCISSLEKGVRIFSRERVVSDLEYLINSGAHVIKFLDRTFNCSPARAGEIWRHILENNISSRYHFEIAADLLTDENFEVLKEVEEGLFQFEIGVQSIYPNVLKSVGRKSDITSVISNIKRLINETSITVHLDLVAGLPGDTFGSISDSLETLLSIRPDHIQLEVLKILKGAPMLELAGKEAYAYSGLPPYRVASTPWLSSDEIDEIEVTGRLIDLIYNSGRFRAAIETISGILPLSRFFSSLARFWQMEEITTLSLENLFELFWKFVTSETDCNLSAGVSDALAFDSCITNYPCRKRPPSFFSQNGYGDSFVPKKDLKMIRDRLNVYPQTRVRAFGRNFRKDYRAGSTLQGEVELLFIYLSSHGKSQEVRVMEWKDVFG